MPSPWVTVTQPDLRRSVIADRTVVAGVAGLFHQAHLGRELLADQNSTSPTVEVRSGHGHIPAHEAVTEQCPGGVSEPRCSPGGQFRASEAYDGSSASTWPSGLGWLSS
jgi:hypothetical protein